MTKRPTGSCIVLHRAIANAGDFLIQERTLRLLEAVRPDLEIRAGRAWLPLQEQFDAEALRTARAIVVSGGPGYQPGMYPTVYPLDRLDRISAPIFLIGLGSFALGDPAADDALDRGSIDFLDWLQTHGGRMGARDDLTKRMLDRVGFPAALMTGDPAWYDLAWLDCDRYASIRGRIAFTPPANPLFIEQGLTVLRRLSQEYGAKNLLVVFHRRTQSAFAAAAADLGATTADISGSAAGFAVFDDVGMHVGYRVHAHLYSLSHETPTYLIAEDSRGRGMLETLADLGVDGLGNRQSRFVQRAWRAAPRLGSERSRLTRSLGRVMTQMARLPDISDALLGQIAIDRERGFERAVDAKAIIRRTYPTMVEMLQAIP
jgi:hypothetical protein